MPTVVVAQDEKFLSNFSYRKSLHTNEKLGAARLHNSIAMCSFTLRSDKGCSGQLQSSTNCGAYQAPLQHERLATIEHSRDPWPFGAIVL